jgi:ubiquitin C-terminal hydrolase
MVEISEDEYNKKWNSDAELDFKVDPSFNAVQKENSKTINILDCFKQLSVPCPEPEVYCPKCKEFRDMTKKTDIWKLPNVLIVNLPRFVTNKYYKDKLTTMVTCSTTTDVALDSFVLQKSTQTNAFQLWATLVRLMVVVDCIFSLITENLMLDFGTLM